MTAVLTTTRTVDGRDEIVTIVNDNGKMMTGI